MLNDPRKYLSVFLTDKPVTFGIGQDTGLAELVIEAGYARTDGTEQIYQPVRVIMTPESSQALLLDLPKLQAVLAQAAKGPTTPNYVQ